MTDYTDAHMPVNIVAGGAGAIDKPMASPNVQESKLEDMGYVAYHTEEYSFGLLHIVNDTHLDWELISSETGNAIDKLSLTKT